MKVERYKSVWAWISLIVMLMSLGFLCFSAVQNHNTTSTLNKWEGKVTLHRANKNTSVVIIQGQDEKSNKKQSLETLLAYNDVQFLVVTLPEKDGVYLVEETMEGLKQEGHLNYEDLLLISVGKTAGEVLAFAEQTPSLQGVVLSSPNAPSNTSFSLEIPCVVVTTTASDQYTPQDATAYYNNLSGEKILSTGFGFKAEKGTNYLEVVPEVYGSYRPYSEEYLQSFVRIAEKAFGWQLTPIPKYKNQLTEISVVLSVIGLIAFLYLFDWSKLPNKTLHSYRIMTLQVISPITFLLMRLVTLVAAVVVTSILCVLIWYLPYFRLTTERVFVLYLLVSGLAVLLQYKKGKVPGTSGKLNIKNSMPAHVGSHILTILVAAFAALPAVCFVFLGFVGVDITLVSLGTGALYTVASFSCFYVFSYEGMLLADVKASTFTKFVYRFSMYLPLLLVAFISIPIGYLTWLYQALIYLSALWVVLALEKPIYAFTGSELSVALMQSLLFGMFSALVQI